MVNSAILGRSIPNLPSLPKVDNLNSKVSNLTTYNNSRKSVSTIDSKNFKSKIAKSELNPTFDGSLVSNSISKQLRVSSGLKEGSIEKTCGLEQTKLEIQPCTSFIQLNNQETKNNLPLDEEREAPLLFRKFSEQTDYNQKKLERFNLKNGLSDEDGHVSPLKLKTIYGPKIKNNLKEDIKQLKSMTKTCPTTPTTVLVPPNITILPQHVNASDNFLNLLKSYGLKFDRLSNLTEQQLLGLENGQNKLEIHQIRMMKNKIDEKISDDTIFSLIDEFNDSSFKR